MLGSRAVRVGLLAGALLAAGCAGRPDAARTLTEADEGSEVTVRVGDVLLVELRTPSSGGAAWESVPPSRSVIDREPGADYLRDPASAALARTAGFSSWRFVAAGPGRETIRFVLHGVGVPETREFRIRVALPAEGR